MRYDQRNYIIIAFGLGFTVIPIIFSIAEDSLSNVPYSMTAASMALGASRWQTLWRVVLPSASPGIFAAMMIGFGRAVGETMIVLMATGNTPILDWSPLERHANALGQHRRGNSRSAGGRNALSSPVFMCGPPVPVDVHGEHGGGVGPPAPAKTLRPVLKRRRLAPAQADFGGGANRRFGRPRAALAGMLSLVFLLLAVVLINGLGVFWPARRGRSHSGRRQQHPRRADPQPSESRHRPAQHPVQDRQSRAGPARQDFHWVTDDTIRADRLSAGGLRAGTERERELLRLPEAHRGPDVAAAPDGHRRRSSLPRPWRPCGGSRRRKSPRWPPNCSRWAASSRTTAATNCSASATARAAAADRQPARPDSDRQIADVEARGQRIKQQSDRLVAQQQQRVAQLRRNVAVFRTAAGRDVPIALVDIVRFYRPNAMGLAGQVPALSGQGGRVALGQPARVEHRGRAVSGHLRHRDADLL